MKLPRRLVKVAAVALAAVVCAVSADSAVLGVNQKYQEQTQWCWAASLQAVLEFYLVSKTQTEIAQAGVGGLNEPNYLYGSDSTHNGVDVLFWYFGSIQTQPYASALSLSTLAANIEYARPVPIRWGWDSGGGHLVVIYGVDGSTVYIMDPWPDTGPTVNTYNWVYQGGGHTWTHSLAMKISPWASWALLNAAYGLNYAQAAYGNYHQYDAYGFLYYAYVYSYYAYYFAYYSYYYKAVYCDDYGYADYAAIYGYYTYLYAAYAYAYETGDPYSYVALQAGYLTYLYSALVTTE